jgi:uncharacterized protein YaaN involved in tellurite resistance
MKTTQPILSSASTMPIITVDQYNVQEQRAVMKPANEQEQQIIVQIKDNINLDDSNSIIRYGVEAQSNISSFTDSILQKVKTSQVGEGGKYLEQMIDEMNKIDFSSVRDDSFMSKLPIIGYWMKKGLKSFTGDFENVQSKINELITMMKNHDNILNSDIKMYDDFYMKTLEYTRNLELFIIAGREKLVDLRQEVAELKAKFEETKDPLDAQMYTDKFKAVDRFEKRLHNLEITRIASINSGGQIRLAQEGNKMLVEDIVDVLHNTLPLWKNQFVMAVALVNSKKALQLTKTVKDYTNKQYVENAKSLNQIANDLGENYSRGILDIETLQEVNNLTISSIKKTLVIQKEAAEKRKIASIELEKMENQIKDALVDAKNQGSEITSR